MSWTENDLRAYATRRLRHEERARTEMATQSTDKLVESLRKAPIRQFATARCCVCQQYIAFGEQYHDGGRGQRAHIGCIESFRADKVTRLAAGQRTHSKPARSIPKAHGSRYSIPVVLAFFAECGLSEPVPEHDFCNGRKWRFDFAWRAPLFEKGGVALEVQGGLFSAGAHVRGAALLLEYEKLNMAAVLGWRVLFVTPDQLCLVKTAEMIRQALNV